VNPVICRECGKVIEKPARKGQLFHQNECKRIANVRRATEYHKKHDKHPPESYKWYPSWRRMERMCLWNQTPESE
jgi:hypothetical protein